MRSIPLRSALALALFFGIGGTSAAQEFRIYTCVYGIPAAEVDAEPAMLSRSLTLFHAGIVYDWVDSADEVTVFDPGNQRFTILNTSRDVVTRIDFQQLERMIEASRQETQRYIDGGRAGNAAKALRFQIDPHFRERYDAEAERLQLMSPDMTYAVRCAEAPSTEAMAAFLKYADWTARLNHALHPRALFPDARIALNGSLRRKQRIPVEVELRADMGQPLHLRAAHRIDWELHSSDRDLIDKWKRQLRDPSTRQLTFPQYQRVILAAKPSR